MFVDLPPAYVQQITCPGDIKASAVAISPDRIISAEHAVAAGGCGTTPIWYDKDYDLYIGAPARPATAVVAVSCAGVVTGQTYELIGFERRHTGVALDRYRTVTSETGIKDNLRAISGRAFVGMSGGAVINAEGKLVGIIVATGEDVTYVRDFTTTSLCDN